MAIAKPWKSGCPASLYSPRFASCYSLARSWASLCTGTAADASQPAAYTGFVVAVGVAEPPSQIGFLTGYDAIADRDRQRQYEDQDPRATRGDADANVDQEKADIDRIARPAVNARGDERAGWHVGRHWRFRARKVANSSNRQRDTDDNEGARDDPADAPSRNSERGRQQAIG